MVGGETHEGRLQVGGDAVAQRGKAQGVAARQSRGEGGRVGGKGGHRLEQRALCVRAGQLAEQHMGEGGGFVGGEQGGDAGVGAGHPGQGAYRAGRVACEPALQDGEGSEGVEGGEGSGAVLVPGQIGGPPGVGHAGEAAFQVALLGGPGVGEPGGGGVVVRIAGGGGGQQAGQASLEGGGPAGGEIRAGHIGGHLQVQIEALYGYHGAGGQPGAGQGPGTGALHGPGQLPVGQLAHLPGERLGVLRIRAADAGGQLADVDKVVHGGGFRCASPV